MISAGRPSFIETLQQKLLDQTLPGKEAHFRMAHAVRRADPVPDELNSRDAAVLLTLFEKTPGDWYLIFIKRTTSHDQDKHSGQFGFPGGKKDSTDPDLMYTALREAEEEVAIDLSAIDVLGALTPLYITVSKFLVHPYVAYSWKMPELSKQEREIEAIFEFPLSRFYDPGARQETRITLSKGIVLNHVPAYIIDGHVIWGATAMILNELLEILAA